MPFEPRWGPETELAIANFPIAQRPLDRRVARALAAIKRHAAAVNTELGAPGLDTELAAAIGRACQRIESGELDDQFPVDVYQTGSGTSINMNVNEVVANLAAEELGRAVSPNDHVNASQSSNDTVPSAIRVAVATAMVGDVGPAIAVLATELDRLAERGHNAVKAGRTHLMDATPVTIGQEAAAWASMVREAARLVERSVETLRELPIGGSAVGTGINVPPGFASRVVERLAGETGLPLRASAEPMVHQGGQGALAIASGALRAVAVALTKVANDVRLLASGPATGLGEIRVPALQKGSSIMPGKVNAVLCESVNQVAARVMGNDVVVGFAASQGILELNTYLPVMADALLESCTLLTAVSRRFAEACVAGIEIDEDRTRSYAEHTLAVATALNPLIGYERAAELVVQARRDGRSILEVVVDEGVLDEAEARELLDPLQLAHPDR